VSFYNYVGAIAVQADGKILVGGSFSTLGGGGEGTTTRWNLGRLNADGSLDTSFDPGAIFPVHAFAVQTDGKILVVGEFTTLGGGGEGTTLRYYLGRLNADGSLDTDFNPGANDNVYAVAVQPDGKILVGGKFTTLGGGGTGTTTRLHIGRLNGDGSVDTSFNADADGDVSTLALQADGKIIVGGAFSILADGARNCLGRLDADGSLDATFDPGTTGVEVSIPQEGGPPNTVTEWSVNALAVQPNAKILVGGRFKKLGGGGLGTATRYDLGRLNADGSLDSGHTAGDFDGGGQSDLTVFRPADGTWYIRYMIQPANVAGFQWGSGNDVPVAGDFNGVGVADLAVFRPSDGTWYVWYSGTQTTAGFQWGSGGDVPVPGDYDGDGKTDIAVFRPSDGTWYIVYSSTGSAAAFQWGNGLDVPVPGDYNGDGKIDLAVFRPSNGTWYIWYSGTMTTAGFQWGNASDVPVPGDYDGDGLTDIAVFRPSNGTWYIRYSATGLTAAFQWGNGLDVPVPGDYDGDGKTDLAVFRPSNGTWYLWYSGTGMTAGFQWGSGSDIPILKRP
jgi:uncharacterized delta-60 repeat protein